MSDTGPRSLPFDVSGRYTLYNIPFLTWVGLVFPLILPPVPLGPVVISLSWNRREWMSHINRSMGHLGRQRKQNGFPMGWLVNVFVNVVDLFTAGLSHLFVTASLLGDMIRQDGSEEERAEGSPVLWVLKWLVLGNVVFLAVYVVCPGLIFRRLFERIERHLYLGYQPPQGSVRSPASQEVSLAYRGVLDPAEIEQASRGGPVLLFAETIPLEKQWAAIPVFEETLKGLATDLSARGVEVLWCCVDVSTPTRYQKVIDYLNAHGGVERGWTLFQNAQAPVRKPVPMTDTLDAAAQALAAREALGLPRCVTLAQDRLDSPDHHVKDIKAVRQASLKAPVILIAYIAPPENERAVRLDIRNLLLPGLRQALRAKGAIVCVVNADKTHAPAMFQDLAAEVPKFKGRAAILMRGGKIEQHERMGALSGWDGYAKCIRAWLEAPAACPQDKPALVEASFHVARSVQEVQHLASRGPVLAVMSQAGNVEAAVKEFAANILPELWPACQSRGVSLCCCDIAAPGQQGVPAQGLLLFAPGRHVLSATVTPGPGSAIDYAAMGRKILAAPSGAA